VTTIENTAADVIREHCDDVWDGIVPVLHDYISIPNVSVDFDADWAEHGFMHQAVDLISDWCRDRPIEGLVVEVIELEGRTPLIYMEIPAVGVAGSDADTVLLYGHLDKQPEMEGWREDLGPWTPVLEGDRLYGRGGADDGWHRQRGGPRQRRHPSRQS
jgi:acetylornithine deacetylase/succinyl-diaminopimelate desuccinylase-like protein